MVVASSALTPCGQRLHSRDSIHDDDGSPWATLFYTTTRVFTHPREVAGIKNVQVQSRQGPILDCRHGKSIPAIIHHLNGGGQSRAEDFTYVTLLYIVLCQPQHPPLSFSFAQQSDRLPCFFFSSSPSPHRRRLSMIPPAVVGRQRP